MLSDKSTVCPVNLLNIAHQKRGVKAAIVNAGKKLPMMSVMDAVSEKLITPILIGDKHCGDLEMLAFSSLNDRGFDAFLFNPLGDFRHDYLPVNIVDIYSDVKWFFPKLKQGQILAIPIETGVENPKCVYCAKEINKQNEIVSIDRAW